MTLDEIIDKLTQLRTRTTGTAVVYACTLEKDHVSVLGCDLVGAEVLIFIKDGPPRWLSEALNSGNGTYKP